MTDARTNYTGAEINETLVAVDAGQETIGGVATDISKVVVNWGPVVGAEAKVGGATKNIHKVEGNTIFFLESVVATGATVAVKYGYDNVKIPQSDIPQLTASLEGIELAAKARRIGIYYSQLAAFQAKTEMGVDLGEVLATQACAELSYEIDTEVVKLLETNAAVHEDLKWNKRLPVGVSKRDHYAGFAEIIEVGSQHIYDATKKHAANYMIASSSLKPIFSMMEGWKAASSAKINGPYFAGELNGIRVYISPAIAAGKFVLGYNGGDMLTSAAVYAPYMA